MRAGSWSRAVGAGAVVAVFAAAVLFGSSVVATAAGSSPVVSVTSYDVGDGTYPGPIAIDRANGFVYTALGQTGKVAVLTVATGEVLDVPVRGVPAAVAVDESKGLAYVAVATGERGGGAPLVGVAVLRGPRVVATVPFTKRSDPSAVLVDAHTQLIYVADQGTDKLTVIKGRHVIGTIKVGRAPTALALDPTTQDLDVANQTSGTVSVVHDGHVIASPKVDADPVAIAIDVITDRAYVVCQQADRVVILHGLRRIRTVTTPKNSWPSSAAVLPATDQVFVGEDGEFSDAGHSFGYLASGYSIIRGLSLELHRSFSDRVSGVVVSADPAYSSVIVGIVGARSRLVSGADSSVMLPYVNGGPAVVGAHGVIWTSDGTSNLERITLR